MSKIRDDAGDFVKRFQGRATAYSKYRPTYPRELLVILGREIGFGRKKVVADIGSGTGILSELFLANGNKVYCVEPNEDMRRVANESLKRYAHRYISVEGTAEATNLGGDTIDLISVGQALHWFDFEKSRAEFARILRRNGCVVIVYNNRRSSGAVEEAYGSIIDKFGKDRASILDVDDAYARRFLAGEELQKFLLPNSQSLDLRGMLGRLASASYMPHQADGIWVEIEKEVRRIIDDLGENGVVTLRYDTVLYLGRVTR